MILPGPTSTVTDLSVLRTGGLDLAIRRRAQEGRPKLGVCGGFQMLGQRIIDPAESGADEVAGLGVLQVITEFHDDKVLVRRAGMPRLDAACEGYDIRHGRPCVLSGAPMIESVDGEEGCVQGADWGTSWHGVFESDDFRKTFLQWSAANDGDWTPGDMSFGAAREAPIRSLGGSYRGHADTEVLMGPVEQGAPNVLPVLSPTGET